jgi:hypothetical protein
VIANRSRRIFWRPVPTVTQVKRLRSPRGHRQRDRGGQVIKKLRHYTATQMLAAGSDLRNTAARLGHAAD